MARKRSLAIFGFVGVLVVGWGMAQEPVPAKAEPAARPTPPPAPQPVFFEVQVDGETFLVESNKVAKVASQKKPGTNYQLAVRFASVQPVRLNTFQFEFDRPAELTDNGSPIERTVKLKHELGYTLFVGDLGDPPNETDVEKILMHLADSAASTFRKLGLDGVKTGEPHTRDFAQTKGRGNIVRYQDKEGFQHTCLIYVLTGKSYCASFVAEYVDQDADDVLPLLKRIIESMRPLK